MGLLSAVNAEDTVKPYLDNLQQVGLGENRDGKDDRPCILTVSDFKLSVAFYRRALKPLRALLTSLLYRLESEFLVD